jgi:hypothetical protein
MEEGTPRLTVLVYGCVQDPEVVEAVAELQRRKELLAELEARAAAFAPGVPSMLQQALQAPDSDRMA